MNIKPVITSLASKKLIGMSEKMSFQLNKTGKLFSTFMPRRKEVLNTINNDTFALQVYPSDYFQNFSPAKEFTKWALVEVSSTDHVPKEMEVFELEMGKYAVFHYKGSSEDGSIFRYIFSEWIPNSTYELDDRPHFEVLGEKTKLNDPESEEEIWIPIKLRE